ncbi:MAG: helix-turn-helix domain-containing protein [Actinophytocola sp.]|uniref:helix-turn-helix domain-containing protein n=1 Tax=Actinophytocola sp. TaxID=1872138 RepID=UPI00132A7D4B|nr:helix-turn-helix transcriptional regulator [Actinophytocola sp.]MPZ79910.1 helix-turn-helix domain-containing protein [Actinophytocola sp.]
MDRRSELTEFLRSCRARRRPEDLGLTPVAGRRRVPGLRREELAQAAALSVDYYVRLEQGRLRNPSESVLDSVAAALALDDAERRHLHNLARPRRTREPAAGPVVRPTLQALLDVAAVPAAIYGHRGEVMAWNDLAAALLIDFGTVPVERRNMAWLLFTDDEVASRYADWEGKARDLVAQLRMAAGADPDDAVLTALIGELSVKSPDFVRIWAGHRVREKCRGYHRYRHPVVGEFTLRYESFRLPDAPNQSFVCQFAEPGTPDEDALALLASWTAGAGRLERVNPQLR